MSQLDERRIAEIVDRVVDRVTARVVSRGGQRHVSVNGNGNIRIPQGRRGVYDDPETAVAAALRGYRENERTSIATRMKMIEAMRSVAFDNLRELAHLAR